MDVQSTAGAADLPTTPEKFEFDAFLSYSTRGNYLLCRRVEAFLEGFHQRVAAGGPALRPLHLCRDGSDFRQWLIGTEGVAPDPVWLRIESALRRCRTLLVVCSPESAKSPWVDREVAWMIRHRGVAHVWLLVAAGADPAAQPEGLMPPSAIAAGLHTGQIWYDLRAWRGLQGDRVRNAEDELVRLAVDLLDLPADTQPGLAAVWQREELRRAKRLALLASAAALAVVVGAGVSGWQFTEARRQALQAQAASQVRVADATLGASPLLSALVAREWPSSHAPADALAVGWRLLGSELPQARLRGHQQAVVAAGWAPGDHVWAVDSASSVSLTPASGHGDATWLRATAPAKVAAAVASADGQWLWVAQSRGTVSQFRMADGRLQGGGVVCQLPAEDVRHIWAGTGTRWILLAGYKAQVYGCDLDHPGAPAQTLPVSGAVLQAGFEAVAGAWQVVTDEGRLWQLQLRGGSPHLVPLAMPEGQGQLQPAVATAAALVPGRFIAISTAEGTWLGQRQGGGWTLRRIGNVGAATALAFAADGERLALAEETTGQVLLLRSQDGERLAQLDHASQVFMDPVSAETLADRPSRPGRLNVTALSWSPDGKQLATLQEGQGIRLWAVGAGDSAAPRRLRGHAGAAQLVWSAKAEAVLSAGDDGDLWLWPRQGPLQHAQAVLQHRLYAAALSPRHRLLALVNGKEQLLLMNADRLDQPPTVLDPPAPCAYADPVQAERHLDAALAFDAQGRLWWLRRDGGLSLVPGLSAGAGAAALQAGTHWCTHAVRARLVPGLPGAVLVDELKRLVVANEAGTRVVGDTSSLQKVTAIGASEGGRWMAAGTQGGDVLRWDLAVRPATAPVVLQARSGTINCLALDEATGGVLSTLSDGHATWQPASGPVLRWHGDGGQLRSCALAAGVGYAAADSGRLWRLDVRSGGRPQAFESQNGVAHIGPLMQLLPLPGEDLLLTGGGVDGQASLWSLSRRRRLATAFMAGTVVALLPDAGRRRVIAVGEGGRVAAWSMDLQALQDQLQAATNANLTPAERADMLGEPANAAYMNYSARERQQQRQPLPREWQFKLPF